MGLLGDAVGGMVDRAKESVSSWGGSNNPDSKGNVGNYRNDTPRIGNIASGLNGNDPKNDESRVTADGRTVYTNADGDNYSYGIKNMPFATDEDGNSIGWEDSNGNPHNAEYKGDPRNVGGYGSSSAGNAGQTAEDLAKSNVESAVERLQGATEASGITPQNEGINKMVDDPNKFLSDRDLTLSDKAPTMDSNAAGSTLDPDDPRYQIGQDVTYTAAQTEAESVNAPNKKPVAELQTDTSADRMDAAQYQVDPVTGEIRDKNLVDAEKYVLDMQGAGTGINADGTTNHTGQALNDYASQNVSMMIDTTTSSGKLLAQKLGEGNYTDTKTTIMGQMETISKEFKDGSGNPVIPPWAQAQHRASMRSIAFKGMTGSAAIAASSNAIMEATLPIAESEAKFFQTLTNKNLDNRQASIINKAKTLASYDLANLEERSVAAVQNAKAFLQMDMENLDHEQEAEVINTQERVDAMFTDVAAENAARRFNIESELSNRQFYEKLDYDAQVYNADAIMATREANAGRMDTAAQFNINRTLERDKFESEMARYIDESNVNWRREVYKTNTIMQWEAAQQDVSNALGLTTEGMNKMWNRVDMQLDYIWKSAEADEQRDYELMMAEMTADANAKGAKKSALGSVVGSVVGGIFSDEKLKDNIKFDVTLSSGVNMYTWDWNEVAKKLGADKLPNFGVIAQEIQKTHPQAVHMSAEGYLKVNYGKID